MTPIPSQLGIKIGIPTIEEVESHIKNDEEVKCVLKGGSVEKRSGVGYKSLACVAVLTDKSVYLVRKGQVIKNLAKSVENIPLHTVTGFEVTRELGLGTFLQISRAGNIDKITQCDSAHAEKFRDLAKEIAENISSQKNSQTVINQAIDPIEQIKKLKDLLDSDIISQEEYEEKKKKLMEKI
jgi:hypothetical protein